MDNYVPSPEDIVRCRIRTTGIVECTFWIDGNVMTMIDLGGQRNERKKWLHCFDEVTAVLFVVAISEYDQVCTVRCRCSCVQLYVHPSVWGRVSLVFICFFICLFVDINLYV